MISQRCPKCRSGRVRRGYRPTPLWSKFLFRYNLLCDNCNWEFTGFAVPGTVSTKPTKRKKNDDYQAERIKPESDERHDSSGKKMKKKRIKVKFR